MIKKLNCEDLRNSVALIMGTRPGIIKMAPLAKAFAKKGIDYFIIHTGQHYSENMDRVFFKNLDLPEPMYKVENTKGYTTHAGQTAEMMKGVESVLFETKPKIVLVCGDANTNLAAGLAARKLGIVVGHVESGLRSHDWTMPEEHNRIILDHISELLFAPTEGAYRNLIVDNVRGHIYLTGNTIVDSTMQNIIIAEQKTAILRDLGIDSKEFILFTAHREENVDSEDRLLNILKGVVKVSQESGLRVIFPAHPRTKKRLIEFQFLDKVQNNQNIYLSEPVGYLESLLLIKKASLVLTDSGGVQEEACILKTPCVTLRDNTERPESISVGANVIAGTDPDTVKTLAMKMLSENKTWEIPFGDGYASVRIADVVGKTLKEGVDLFNISEKPRWSGISESLL